MISPDPLSLPFSQSISDGPERFYHPTLYRLWSFHGSDPADAMES